jgi:hypothetical protein
VAQRFTAAIDGVCSASQFADKLDPAPKGAIDPAIFAVSLKRYPDTKRIFSANCSAAEVNFFGFDACGLSKGGIIRELASGAEARHSTNVTARLNRCALPEAPMLELRHDWPEMPERIHDFRRKLP